MNIKNAVYGILFMSGLIFSSCAQGGNDSEPENEVSTEASTAKEDLHLEAFLKKKSLVIEELFNIVAFKTIDWIEKDRVEYSPDKKRPELTDVPLNNYQNVLVNVNTKEYARRFIEIRDSIIGNVNNSNFNLKEKLQSVLNSKFYKNDILNEASTNLNLQRSEYIINLKKVDASVKDLIDDATDNYYNLKIKTPYGKAKNKDKTGDEKSFENSFNTYTWGFLILLLISLILNLLQFFKYKKTKKHHKKALSKANYERQEVTHNHSSFQRKATRLSISEVKSAIEQAYVKFQQTLKNQYHKDCLAEVSIKFDNLKTDTISEASSSSFYNKTELQKFIATRISQDRSTLNDELKNYVAKNDAKLEIDNRIVVQNFVQAVNTNIIQEEDIANKVQQLKQIAVSELLDVTTIATLNNTIITLEKDIKMALQKMVRDNSVFYFAFADTNGTLQDAKKTKSIERDSAIELSVNPDDIIKATFRLLLEKDDMMQAGIMSYDSFLIPICELTSDNFNSTGTTIQQIGPDGTMELENGIWKVKNKLPIKVI